MALQPDGKILAGGTFQTSGSPSHNGIVRLNANGSIDTTFTGTGTGHFSAPAVYAIALQPDGTVVLGGAFTTVNGTARNYIARLNSNGSIDTTFNPNANQEVLAVSLQGDGKILIGGNFTTVSTQAHQNIARLNTNGSLESTATFNPPSVGTVNCIAVQSDGKILVAGFVSVQFSGESSFGVVRLNSNGTLDPTFSTHSVDLTEVQCMAVQPDGKILLGGSIFESSPALRHVTRINSNGTLDSTFDIGSGASGFVHSLCLQADGKILVGGEFTTMNNQTRNNVARLNSNGTLDSTFTIGSGADRVWAMALQPNGQVLLGGTFSAVNGQAAAGMARVRNDTATQTLSIPELSSVQWLRTGSCSEVEAVTFDLSANAGGSWAPLGDGTRSGNLWQLTGLVLPVSGTIRARGRTMSGWHTSNGLIEQTQTYSGATASGLAATNLSDTGAKLNGVVNAKGNSATVTFEYGTTNAYGTSAAGIPSPVTGTADTAVSATLTNLFPGTIYHYRVNGTNVMGTTSSADVTFTTLTRLQQWRQTWFNTTANQGNAADTATPQGDGISNFLKFATAMDPTKPGRMPGVVTASGSNLTFVYTRSKSAVADGLIFTIEFSDSLQSASWSSQGVSETVSVGATTELVTASIPLGAGSKRFVRLKVVK